MSVRQKCFDYWKLKQGDRTMLPCHCDTCCGHLFDPSIERWEAAHIVARANGGSDEPTNVRPMKYKCHRSETANKDIPQIAAGKRKSKKHYGVKRKSGFRKPNAPPGMKYNSFARRFEPI